MMTVLIATATAIAGNAHRDQYRRDGITPYMKHPLAVATAVEHLGEDYVVAAILHDVLEDTPVTVSELLKAGIPDRIVDAVLKLTRGNESYENYLYRVSSDPIARAVKIADINHNLSDKPTPKQTIKYRNALALLRNL